MADDRKSPAYILVECDDDVNVWNAAADAIRKIDYVKSAIMTYGNYDIVVEMNVDVSKELCNSVTKEIRSMGGIRTTMTLLPAGDEYHAQSGPYYDFKKSRRDSA